MAVRREANDTGSLVVRHVKEQIAEATGITSPSLSLDHLVRKAAKEGFHVVVSCVRLK